ncbi:MAG TPA: ABC transporter substrate-binding protein [Methylomirabilota bacterium]|jgi:phospholipid transport system substrate-binding protein|nr:ABC transporter substrate-binding protein [Methylomirabilota bacterium]
MMRTRHVTMMVMAACLVLLFLSPAWAGEPTEQLRGSVDRVIQILDDPKLQGETAERRAAVRKVANEIFDFSETAKRALGRHWQTLSEKDRQEFVSLFADLLERSYISKIEQYRGERIRYAGDSVEGDSATVKTRLVTKNGTEVPVDYRMLRVGDRWRVYDVSIEGVSLVGNYRTQFNKIIQTASYEELVKKMRARDEGLGGAAPQGKTPRS